VIVDAHNDLLLELVLRSGEENPFGRRWLPRLREGGVALQVCPLYAAGAPQDEAPRRARAQVEQFERALRENTADVFAVRTREDLEHVGRDGRIGLMLSMEGVEAVADGFDPWWDAGVRMVSLTWNYPNWAAGGMDAPDRGLTAEGRALVDELAERGAVLDVAHASPPTFDGVLERAPHVVCSHACCRALTDVPRNLSDAQLEALAARGGVLGIMALALVVGYGNATLDGLVDHVDHAASVMGPDGVGLGADVIDQVTQAELELGEALVDVVAEALELGGGRMGLEGFTGPEHYPAVVAALRQRGYDGERLDAVTHGNLLRMLGEALPRG
jgi:membrane dipeptidase